MAMNFQCEQIEERLSDFLDGALTAGEAVAFSAHIATCAACAELVSSVRGLVGEMHALEPEDLPPHFIADVLDKTLGPRKSPDGWKSWFTWLRPVFQPRFAYGALTVLVTIGVVSQALGIQWRKPTVADLNPVNLYREVDRQAHLVYSRGAKFVGDLRVVYEIRSRLQPDLEDETPAQPAPAAQPTSPGRSETPTTDPRSPNHAKFLRNATPTLAASMWVASVRSKP
jgi:anti-sigma factor RsiW